MIREGYVNEVIVGSIPIDRNLKRWLISRFRKLCSCNGRAYASDVFKTAKEVCMAYRADPRRLEKVAWYDQQLPFRSSGWTKKILGYMDVSPLPMLDLLKLYCSSAQPVVTVEQSADREHTYLRRTEDSVMSQVPRFLSTWVNHLSYKSCKLSKPVWDGLKRSGNWPRWLYAYGKNHSWYEYSLYWEKWHHILFHTKVVGEQRAREDICEKMPFPEVYKDFSESDVQSRNLDQDYYDLATMLDSTGLTPELGWFTSPVLSQESLAYVRSYLNQEEGAVSLLFLNGDKEEVVRPSGPVSFLSGETVGQIQHIPKKGTVKRRPIAVPNRFLQMGLAPLQDQLYLLVRRLPCDCTFDQSRFDVKIESRVTNPGLYVGSVDLSQATDNLPRAWGEFCVEKILLWRCCPTVKQSYRLFQEMAGGRWDNDGHISTWPVGQPLGTLPSFGLLAITHNLLLESLSFALGMGHSPYCILGDDLLVFNKKVRKAYIRFMQDTGVPLSLHKSYEGNLVEFAGKTFIRNQFPGFVSDHAPLTWNSLFDYQRATGVRIPWQQLPRKLRRQVESLTSSLLTKCDGRRVYQFCQLALLDQHGSLRGPLSQRTMDRLAQFYLGIEPDEDKLPPQRELDSGIVMVAGHPVVYGNYDYADKNGHFVRFRRIELPQWYKEKFRPCATDKLVLTAAQVLKDI
jgi:hypothetical protein